MKSALLFLLLYVLFAATTLGIDLNIAPGLSVKNVLLYFITIVYVIDAAVQRNISFDLPSVIVPFGLFIGYCTLSWYIASFLIKPTYYQTIPAALSLKNERYDHIIIFLLCFYSVTSVEKSLTSESPTSCAC